MKKKAIQLPFAFLLLLIKPVFGQNMPQAILDTNLFFHEFKIQPANGDIAKLTLEFVFNYGKGTKIDSLFLFKTINYDGFMEVGDPSIIIGNLLPGKYYITVIYYSKPKYKSRKVGQVLSRKVYGVTLNKKMEETYLWYE